MKPHKPRSWIDRMRRRRSQAVLALMDENGLTPEIVAKATGLKTATVYHALEGHRPGHQAIEFLERRLGHKFTELWQKKPGHAA